jgi:hypothetical protein
MIWVEPVSPFARLPEKIQSDIFPISTKQRAKPVNLKT